MARWIFVALITVVVVLGGCATERDPISRVQAGAFDKSFFVGPKLRDSSDDPEFYMRTTVVDVAAGAGGEGLFTNSDSMPMTRIKWEITEENLVARLTYELIKDTDHKGARKTNDGQVVAMFRIEKHFDVKREYNATTGEELNVIGENESDRAWYDRQFIRVDWSKNLITDAYDLDTLSQLGIYSGVHFEPLAHYAGDKGVDGPLYDGKRGYLDITHKVLASPLVIHDEEWGDFPACWLTQSWPRESCNPSEVTLRSSFLRVEDHDYEMLDFDGRRMDLFGYFTQDRLGFDLKYGVIDEKWHRFAARWNVFEKSHANPVVACNTAGSTPPGKDPHRDDNGNGTEDECESVGKGSRCDAFRGECTLPYRQRKVKTITWYVNPDFPEELFAGTAESLTTWSDSVRVALVAGRLAECRKLKEDGCEAQMGWPARWSDDYVPPLGTNSLAEVPKVFVLCHNPVDHSKGDDQACGADKLAPRLGDLRYNMITHIMAPQLESPWGIMMDAEDPLTGEKISGSVSQWEASLDRASGGLVDMIGLINGDIAPNEYIKGKSVDEWVRDVRAGGTNSKAMSASEIASRQKAFDPAVLAARVGRSGALKTANGPPAARRQARYRQLLDAGKLGPGNGALTGRFGKLRRSSIEAQLATPELTQAAGLDPTGPLTPDTVRRASPFERLSPLWRRTHERARKLGLASRHSCHMGGDEPDNLIGLAKAASHLFPAVDKNDAAATADRNKRLFTWARQEFSKGVYSHELGHSMGLRHNFAGSFDSLNYQPQYWQLRTKNGTVTAECPKTGGADGESCVGPRWLDPITPAEVDNNIGRYAQTTVMDYPGDANHDQLLPGKYDRAAIRFGYGGVVDVWDKPGVSVKATGVGQGAAYRLLGFTQSPGLWGIFDFPPVDPTKAYDHIHYSQYQKLLGILGECHPDDSPGSVLGQKCNGHAMDVVDYDSMADFDADPAYAAYSQFSYPHAVDAQGRVRRGYMFSSDEFSDTGNVPSFTYDSGADAYEQIRFLESVYEYRYILDGFRRNRTGFNSMDYVDRIQSHYLDALQMVSKAWAFGALLEGDPTAPNEDVLKDGNFGALAMGSTVAFDLFARVLTRPEPGSYCSTADSACPSYQPAGVAPTLFAADPLPTPSGSYAFTIPIGAGRYVHNDYDYGQGYWWSDYQSQAGAYYEKIWAIFYLSEAFDSFVSNSKEDFTDGRYKNVSFATIYPKQVRRLFSSILTGDLESYAPWTTSKKGSAEITYPAWHDIGLLPARPAGSAMLDPNFGWNEQLFAMVFGTMFFPTDWSMNFINDARITTLNADQIQWPAGETYAFYDPETGITYRAHDVGTEDVFGKSHKIAIGARSLEWANLLVTLAYKVQRDGQNDPLLDPEGKPKLSLDANGRPQLDPANANANAALRKFVQNLDILRELTSTFAGPLTENDLPDP